MRRLIMFPDAVFNQAFKLGIDKGKDPPWMFAWCNHIKRGICINRLKAALQHHKTSRCGERRVRYLPFAGGWSTFETRGNPSNGVEFGHKIGKHTAHNRQKCGSDAVQQTLHVLCTC